MTSRSDGLGPQKDPNSGRTRVESGPAGTHRPTTRRGSPIASTAQPRVRAGPSHRHARRAAGDRGPWVSLPLRATIPEGNTVGQHADVDVGPSHRAIASSAGAEGGRDVEAYGVPQAGADDRRGDAPALYREEPQALGRVPRGSGTGAAIPRARGRSTREVVR